jgi:hypothetical protein
MLPFWIRAVQTYETLQATRSIDFKPFFDNYALIISDLGQSLYMLIGRHWTEEVITQYLAKVPDKAHYLERHTPDIIDLFENYYPVLKIAFPSNLFKLLKAFINDCYKDIVKHFEAKKFQKALTIDQEQLDRFMEITRLTWRWYLAKSHKMSVEETEAASLFQKQYHALPEAKDS